MSRTRSTKTSELAAKAKHRRDHLHAELSRTILSAEGITNSLPGLLEKADDVAVLVTIAWAERLIGESKGLAQCLNVTDDVNRTLGPTIDKLHVVMDKYTNRRTMPAARSRNHPVGRCSNPGCGCQHAGGRSPNRRRRNPPMDIAIAAIAADAAMAGARADQLASNPGRKKAPKRTQASMFDAEQEGFALTHPPGTVQVPAGPPRGEQQTLFVHQRPTIEQLQEALRHKPGRGHKKKAGSGRRRNEHSDLVRRLMS